MYTIPRTLNKSITSRGFPLGKGGEEGGGEPQAKKPRMDQVGMMYPTVMPGMAPPMVMPGMPPIMPGMVPPGVCAGSRFQVVLTRENVLCPSVGHVDVESECVLWTRGSN